MTGVGAIASSYAPAGGTFSPLALTALTFWYDTTDAATFTYGTGSQVATWDDKSGNGLHLSRTASAAMQRNGTINGVTAIDVTEAEITRASVQLQSLVDSTNRTDLMSFAVMELDNTAQGVYLWLLGSTYRFGWVYRAPNSYWDITSVSNRIGGATAVSTATPYLITVTRNGATETIRRNGVQILSKTNASGGVAASDTGTLRIAAGNTIDGTFNGRLGDLVHVARYDATDLAATETYLANKFGITI